jgi:hypothetical protein
MKRIIKSTLATFFLISAALTGGCSESQLPSLTTEQIKQGLEQSGKPFYYGTSYPGEKLDNPAYFLKDTILGMQVLDRATDSQAKTQNVKVKIWIHLNWTDAPHAGTFNLTFKHYDEGWRLESGLEKPIFLPETKEKAPSAAQDKPVESQSIQPSSESKMSSLTTEQIKQCLALSGKSFYYVTSYPGEKLDNPAYFLKDTILGMQILDRATDSQAKTQKIKVKIWIHLNWTDTPHAGVFNLTFKHYDEGWRLESGLEEPVFLPETKEKAPSVT